MKPLFQGNHFYCPIDDKYHLESEYLKGAISEEKTRWIANMVTWYRHNHISSWNKCWSYNGRYYRRGWFGNYEEEKSKVNERTKRQIIRKCENFLLYHRITSEDFKRLQHNDQETLKLANAKLDYQKLLFY